MNRRWRLLALPTIAACLLPLTSTSTSAATTPSGPIRLGYCGGDDWEPSIATQGGYIYVAITHYVGATSCDPASGNQADIYLQLSSDGGHTFSAPHVVFTGAVNGVTYTQQADPSVAVSSDGAVYVGFLGYGLSGGHTDVVVAKSSDHGATFPTATKVNTKDCKNCDHEKLVVSGSQLYVAYTQASGHFVARSTDGGVSWAQSQVITADVVGFAEGGVADAAGNVYFAWADCRSGNCTGVPATDYSVSKTTAGTLATTFTAVATGVQGPNCPDSKCGFSYFGPQDDIAIDAAGTLYLVWQQGQNITSRGSPTVLNLSRSTDHGQTWSFVGRADDKSASGCKAASCYALFPQLIAGAAGALTVMWMDDRTGTPINHENGWNVWLRTSASGGSQWTPSQQLSAYDPTQAQSQVNGFLFPYGDYMGLVSSACGPLAVWGEGQNWVGTAAAPGHIEFRAIC